MGAAILRGQEYLNLALRAGYRMGEGGGPVNHLAPWIRERARADVLAVLDDFGRRLTAATGLKALLPRGRAELAVAVPFADSLGDVAGFSGGFVTASRGRVDVVGYPEFGVPGRAASLLLSVRRVRPDVYCAVSLGGGEAVRAALAAQDLAMVTMDWDGRPEYVDGGEGGFEEWGGLQALKDHAAPETVRALVDPGGLGREPLVYVLAPDAADLSAVLRRIVGQLAEHPGEV